MKKISTLICFLFISIISFAQLENANWCFRHNARVNFNPLSVSTSANGGQPDPIGAPASVSDANGNLLFYTNGNIIWDRNSNIMPNGTGLNSFQNNTTSQSTLIVPKPNHPNIYYVFTFNSTGFAYGIPGFYYTVVDMCLNSGKGDVVSNQKNIPLKTLGGMPIQYNNSNPALTNILEARLTSTSNNNNTKIWVSFFTRFGADGVFSHRLAYNYLVSENGINSITDGTSPNATTEYTLTPGEFPDLPSNGLAFGCIKFSPNSAFLCDANSSVVNLYAFNNTTGAFTFLDTKYIGVINTANAGYGVEFSPNSSLIYFTSWENILHQTSKGGGGEDDDTIKVMRVRQANVATRGSVVVGEFEVPADTPGLLKPPPVPHDLLGNVQLAINNLIYICSINAGSASWLGVIQSPNTPGPGCSFITNGLQLPQLISHEGGLPQWVHKTVFTPVNPCPSWPKAYGSVEESLVLIKDYFGNPILGASAISFAPNSYYNHTGIFPTGSSITCVQYNNTGNTNWLDNNINIFPVFAFKSGVVQLNNLLTNTTSFVNGNNGNNVAPPINLNTNQYMFAETNTGEFITSTFVNNGPTILSVHSANNPPSSTNIGNSFPFKFNPTTDNILVPYSFPAVVKLYHFSGTSIDYVNTYTVPSGSPINPIQQVAQIDNQDRIYFIQNDVLKCFDYQTGNISPVTITGFNNNNLQHIENVDFYTGNMCLVYNRADNYLYCLDLKNLVSKKVLYTGPTNNWYHLKAIFDNDDVYITGKYFDAFQIGNQSLPQLPSYAFVKIFITKINVQTDFSFRQIESKTEKLNRQKATSFEVFISPNPTTDIIRLRITEKAKARPSFYSLIITNHTGTVVLRKNKYSSNSPLSIINLQKGIYYVEISNANGEKLPKSFIKF